jgi:hypothetical protein
VANAAFIQANAAYISQNTTGGIANGAYNHANSAYLSQNVTGSYANTAYNQANSAFAQANAAYAYANASVALLASVGWDLDDLSRLTDGVRTTFPIQYNLTNVTVQGTASLLLEIDGKIQPSFANTYDVTWQSQIFAMNKGFTLTPDGQIQLVIPPRSGADILLRVVTGSENSTVRRYPFKPIDIIMGY